MPTKTVTILYDSRERKPLHFPDRLLDVLEGKHRVSAQRTEVVNLIVVKRMLPVADYMLETGEARGVLVNEDAPTRSGVVETKRSLSEIAANVLGNPTKRRNFNSLLVRMRRYFSHPLLVIEGGLTTLYSQSRDSGPPGPTVDALQRILMEHKMPFVLVPERSTAQRRHIADFVARWLVNGAMVNGDLPC